MKVKCRICPHGCLLDQNEIGFCRARSNSNDRIESINYGQITAMALDPIEKKPLYHFHPGSQILSVGSFGCNLRCGFCQNHHISMLGAAEAQTSFLPPAMLAEKAGHLTAMGNIGVAYTYNEPLIGFEYLLDCAKAVRAAKLLNVMVSNGYACPEPLREVLPLIDAVNIDLKGFTDTFYRKVRGRLDTVKESIKLAYECCHVEIATLIIPGENDTEEEMTAIARWIADIDKEIPLHISRFFPHYHYQHLPPTEVQKIYRLREIAAKHLSHVHTGNC